MRHEGFRLTDKVALEMHAHAAKEGSESLRYESVAPAVHVLLTPQGQRFSFGVSAEYAFAHDAESDDVADVAAVFGYEHNRWMAGANILYEKASSASGEFGYAAGVRRTFRGKHGVGFGTHGLASGRKPLCFFSCLSRVAGHSFYDRRTRRWRAQGVAAAPTKA